MNNSLKGFVALVSASILYGLYGTFAKLISFKFDLFFQFWTRALIASFVLGLILLFRKKVWKAVRRKDWKWYIARSLSNETAGLLIFIGFVKLTVGTAYFLFYAGSTIGGYLVGMFLFRERMTKGKLLALMLASIGLCTIYSFNYDGGKLLFLILSFIAGISASFWNTFSKSISQTYSVFQLAFLDNLIGAVMTFTVSVVLREHWITPSLDRLWIYNILFAGVFVVTGPLVAYGFRYLEASVGSVILLLEVVAGVIFAFMFFRETLTVTTIIGGSLILSASVLPYFMHRRASGQSVGNRSG